MTVEVGVSTWMCAGYISLAGGLGLMQLICRLVYIEVDTIVIPLKHRKMLIFQTARNG